MHRLLPCEEWYSDPARLWVGGVMGKTWSQAQAVLGRTLEPLEKKAVKERKSRI